MTSRRRPESHQHLRLGSTKQQPEIGDSEIRVRTQYQTVKSLIRAIHDLESVMMSLNVLKLESRIKEHSQYYERQRRTAKRLYDKLTKQLLVEYKLLDKDLRKAFISDVSRILSIKTSVIDPDLEDDK